MTDGARTILIVDDEPHILQVLTLKLRNSGFSVITAADGEEALDIACSSVCNPSNGCATQPGSVEPGASQQRSGIDLIITDFQMPYMTGLELCRHLAVHPHASAVPVVLLTARGYALGAADVSTPNIKAVLSKPFSPRELVQRVHDILDGENSARGRRKDAA